MKKATKKKKSTKKPTPAIKATKKKVSAKKAPAKKTVKKSVKAKPLAKPVVKRVSDKTIKAEPMTDETGVVVMHSADDYELGEGEEGIELVAELDNGVLVMIPDTDD